MQTQPFAGIRVIEFGQFVAVPFCAQLLAQGGAHVIKIEALEGDPVRQLGQLAEGETRIFLSRNRGKKSLPLALREPGAVPVIDRLLRDADVALMNFRPGLARTLGLDGPTLRRKYPRLVIGTVTPFGENGPDAHKAGMDTVVQARSGLMVANGRQDNGRPVPGDPVSADHMCAMTLAFGIASALLRRAITGEGGEVHTSLLQAAMTINNSQMLRIDSVEGDKHVEALQQLREKRAAGSSYDDLRGENPAARANSMRSVYFRTYSTADGWLAVACGSPALRKRFAEAVGLDDPYFGADFEGAVEHYTRLGASSESIFAAKSTAEWETILDAVGVPASDVKFPIEMLDDEQVMANGMLADIDHPVLGTLRAMAPPLRLDDDAFRVVPATARFGSETRSILAELGFDDSEIDALVAAGVTREA
jgi:crotonobetainyl-CoA:carnitine CoA-transferase CaiB-like acyl-CoA transferase